MPRFPLSLRILFAAITVLVVFAAICFASPTLPTGEAILSAKRVVRATSKVSDHPAGSSPHTRVAETKPDSEIDEPGDRADRNLFNAFRHVKQGDLKSQKTYSQ